MKINLKKVFGGFVPADPQATEYMDKQANGTYLTCEIKKPRNGKFHRKYFALLNTGFEWWNPFVPEIENDIQKYGVPEKNFERFRKEVIILAGYCDPVFNTRGELRLEAKSISFANMDDDVFADLYDKTLNVLLKLAPSHIKKQDFEIAVEHYMSFA